MASSSARLSFTDDQAVAGDSAAVLPSVASSFKRRDVVAQMERLDIAGLLIDWVTLRDDSPRPAVATRSPSWRSLDARDP